MGSFHYFHRKMSPSRKIKLLVYLLAGKMIILVPLAATSFGFFMDSEETFFSLLNRESKAFIFSWIFSLLVVIIVILLFRRLFGAYERDKERVLREVNDYSARLTSFIESPEFVSIYSLDRNLRYTGFNSLHKREMTEYFKSEIKLGDTILDKIPEAIRDKAEQNYLRALKGEHFTSTSKFAERFYTQIFNPVYDENHQVIGLTSNIFDVSDRVLAEQELERYKDQLEKLVEERTDQLERQTIFFQKIIDNLPNLIFVRDADHKYVMVNKAMADSFGLNTEDFVGKGIQESHNSVEDALIFEEEDEEIFRSNHVIQEESQHQYPDGNKRWLYLIKRMMKIGDEKFILGVHNDITYLKETEHKLIGANEELKQTLNRLKTAQLRLLESEKMASLGQLTAGLAHEINNPINYVAGNIAPIRRDLRELQEIINLYIPEQKRQEAIKNKELILLFEELDTLLEGVDEGAARVKALMADLNTFSLPDRQLKNKCDINESIRSTLNLIKPQLRGKIELEQDLHEIPEIVCNPQQMRQVFLNIITNAIQAIPDEGKIFISSFADERLVYVQVSDTGIGMDEEVQSKVFDPFFTTKDVGKGTGLGLSLSYRIVEDHGGKISVRSKFGHGTSFTVSLPI